LELLAEQVRMRNAVVSLMSLGDLDKIATVHIPDSLSLAKLLRDAVTGGAQWCDIGSGGGFPAMPVCIALPAVSCTLFERNERKCRALGDMAAALGLDGVRVVRGDFPDGWMHPAARLVFTARAIETPERFHRRLAARMISGDTFLCQTAPSAVFTEKKFHVEHIEDGWTAPALRRGVLWKIIAP